MPRVALEVMDPDMFVRVDGVLYKALTSDAPCKFCAFFSEHTDGRDSHRLRKTSALARCTPTFRDDKRTAIWERFDG